VAERKFFIAANFKMHKDQKLMQAYLQEIKSICYKQDPSVCESVDVALAPAAIFLQQSKEALGDCAIKVVAQNCHWQDSGAYTGELSIDMLKSIATDAVLIGHSERRKIFLESDALIAQKLQAANNKSFCPIVCIGEALEDRKANKSLEVVAAQIDLALGTIKDPKDLIIAYEPVWAIGTGLSATPEQVQEVHSFLRTRLAERFSFEQAQKTRIIYGGSVNKDVLAELLMLADVDGALVGGASLDAKNFFELINIANSCQKKK
jgi:triosephosphate isomerase (TIM)